MSSAAARLSTHGGDHLAVDEADPAPRLDFDIAAPDQGLGSLGADFGIDQIDIMHGFDRNFAARRLGERAGRDDTSVGHLQGACGEPEMASGSGSRAG